MKALKNESTLYVEQITSAISDCYRQNTEPTDAEQSLSKLALMKAIDGKTFEAAKDDKTTAQSVATACATVSDADTNQTVDTAGANKTACGAFVTACEPPRQGDGAPTSINSMTAAKIRGILKRQFAMYKADAGQAARPQPIYLHQTDIPPFPAWADRGKPPNQFPPGILSAKKKNAFPDGKTHSAFKRQPPHQMARAA